jgi:glycosyltransferase involved in cell wall biosynthesis
MLIVNGSFVDKSLTGVQRYAYEICLALKARGYPFRIAAPCLISLPEYASLNDRVDVVAKTAFGKLLRWEQGDLFRHMLRRRADTLWNPSNLALMGPFRQITTIHDLAVYRNKDWFNWKFAALYKLYTPYTVRASRALLTVSETVKGEIVSRFGVPAGKITAAHNGWRPPVRRDASAVSAAPAEPYVLILGSLDPRKNLGNALQAWRGLRDDLKTRVKLYVVGGASWSLAHKSEETAEDGKGGIRFLGRVSDAELDGLLENCLANVYLSRYEGFGLPVLEALVRNKRNLISDIPVFRELFGPGCDFVDPESVPEITRGLERLIGECLRGESGEAFGEAYIRRFSWSGAAEALMGLLDG